MSFDKFFDSSKEIPENPLTKEELEEEPIKEEPEEDGVGEDQEEKPEESQQEESPEVDEKTQNVLKKFGIEKPDESVGKMAKSYSEVERALHRNFQEVSESKKEIAQMKETMAQLVEKLDNQNKEEEPEQAEMTEEEKKKTIEELFDLMYENPLDFADKLYELKLGKKIEEQITDYMQKNNLLNKPEEAKEVEIGPEEQKWIDYATEFINGNGLSIEEVQKLSPQLDAYLRDNPDVVLGDKNPYVIAYKSIQKPKEEVKPKEKPEPEITEEQKQKIIEEYKKSLEKPPKTITEKGGSVVVTPPNKPTDIKSASRMFRQHLGLD